MFKTVEDFNLRNWNQGEGLFLMLPAPGEAVDLFQNPGQIRSRYRGSLNWLSGHHVRHSEGKAFLEGPQKIIDLFG